VRAGFALCEIARPPQGCIRPVPFRIFPLLAALPLACRSLAGMSAQKKYHPMPLLRPPARAGSHRRLAPRHHRRRLVLADLQPDLRKAGYSSTWRPRGLGWGKRMESPGGRQV